MKFNLVAFAAALVMGVSAGAWAATPATGAPAAMPNASAAATTAPKLHAAMRGLWQGHIAATRDYALAIHAGQKGNAVQAENKVIDNAKQISAAVAGFYGQAAGDGLFKLLGGHWAGVKALTLAAQAKNSAGEGKAMDELAQNAGAIAKFLAGANPNWTEAGLNQGLLMHVGDHKLQVDAMMGNAPAPEQAKLWTDMQHHMDMIADVLSDGIAKQFPNQAN